jgi:transposase
MKDGLRVRYMLKFKQEVVWLARVGETLALAARTLGVSAQSLDNWVKAEAAGRLLDVRGKDLTAEQMEIARLRAALCGCGWSATSRYLADRGSVPRVAGQRQQLPSTPITASYGCCAEPASPLSQRYGPGCTHQSGLRRDEGGVRLAQDIGRK